MRKIALLLLAAVSFAALAQMPDRGTWMAGGDDSGSGLPSNGFPWIVAAIWVGGIIIAALLPKRAQAVALPIAQLWPLAFVVFESIAWVVRR